MPYWSSETIKRRAISDKIIERFDERNIQSCAYELALGCEAYITSSHDGRKTILKSGEQLIIPPGQFALLLTEEKIYIPTDSIGFISIKAGIKFRGLVNFSGFHVDPGFSGHLKFAVYNAGSRQIVMSRGKPTFMLWLASLDVPTASKYNGEHADQDSITDKDIMDLQGEVASPAALNERLNDLELKFKLATTIIVTIVIAGLVTIGGGVAVNKISGPSNKPSFVNQSTAKQSSPKKVVTPDKKGTN